MIWESAAVTQLKVGSPDEWAQRDQLLKLQSELSVGVSRVCRCAQGVNFLQQDKQKTAVIFVSACVATLTGHLHLNSWEFGIFFFFFLEKKGLLISFIPGLMFVFAQSHKLLARKVTVPRRRAHARRPAAPAHGFVLPNEPGAVSLSSAPAVKITFEKIVRLQRATYLLMFQLSPSSLCPLRPPHTALLSWNAPFECCLSFTFSPEWKMSLRDPVRSCPFWRLELKALDGPIERSPIERSPTNRWQKAFRVINVVQTT